MHTYHFVSIQPNMPPLFIYPPIVGRTLRTSVISNTYTYELHMQTRFPY